MSSNLKITLRFIRKDAHAKTDDMVYISRYGPGQFNLSYTYGDTKTKTAHQLVLTDQAVFRWMRATIAILEKDADPFSRVQLDTPFMPSVVFNVSELGEAYHPLLDALEFHLDNWPTPRVLNPEEDTANYYYDNHGEEEEEEEEDYADMPELVRMPSPIARHGRQHLFLDEDY